MRHDWAISPARDVFPAPEPPSSAGYRRWDWDTSTPSDWVGVDPARPILVEGCGALTLASAPLAICRVWLELDEPVRRHRALARDKGGYDPYWDIWATQEQTHWRENHPWALADLTVRGGPRHQPPAPR